MADADSWEFGIRPQLTQRFIVADGGQLERQFGVAIVHAAGAKASDFVVFAEAGDMVLLGARSREGLNVRVDAQRKQLVPAGPILAGALGGPRTVCCAGNDSTDRVGWSWR